MPDDAERTSTPKLRFPEFRDGERWEAKILGREGEFLSSLTGKSAEDFGAGKAKYITYMNVFSNTFTDITSLGTVNVEIGELQNAVRSGDVLFTVSSETPEEVGMSSVVLETIRDCYLNSFCAMFRFAEEKRPNSRFVGYLMRQSLVRDYFTKHAQGSTRFNLSKNTFRHLPIAIPAEEEQRKVADCLTLLDDVISAQGRKVAALKAHKKGLMQQLFPREGEALPRFRFPEFCNAPEWKETSLGQVIDFQSGGTPSKGNPAFWNGSIPWVSAKDMKRLFLDDTEDHITTTAVDDGAKQVPAGTVLMLTRGMTLLNDVPICILRCQMSFNQDVKALRPKGNLDERFLPFLLLGNKQRLLSMVDLAGHGTGRLDTEELKALVVMLPQPVEQQQISDCLFSLETLIRAESEKLTAFKVHKKGLMQQLFPSPEDD